MTVTPTAPPTEFVPDRTKLVFAESLVRFLRDKASSPQRARAFETAARLVEGKVDPAEVDDPAAIARVRKKLAELVEADMGANLATAGAAYRGPIDRAKKKMGAPGEQQPNNREFEKQHPRTRGGKWMEKGIGMGEGEQPDEQTKQLQQRLHELGFKLTQDGRFGGVTEQAVKSFQTQNGLEPTGKVDEITVETLRNPPPVDRATAEAEVAAMENPPKKGASSKAAASTSTAVAPPSGDDLVDEQGDLVKAGKGGTVGERDLITTTVSGSKRSPSSAGASSTGGARSPVHMISGPNKGVVEPGNIDLSKRPVVKNADGSISTVKSMSIGTDKGETLIPQVVGGKVVSQAEAIKHYHETGENLGTFDSVESANAYAERLHEQQAKEYGSKDAGGSKDAASSESSSASSGSKRSSSSELVRRGDGMTGSADASVKQLQQQLDDLGYELGDGGTDGKFGEDTESAIKLMQRRYGLRVDGIVGPQTRSLIERLTRKRKENAKTPLTVDQEADRLKEAGMEREETVEASYRNVGPSPNFGTRVSYGGIPGVLPADVAAVPDDDDLPTDGPRKGPVGWGGGEDIFGQHAPTMPPNLREATEHKFPRCSNCVHFNGQRLCALYSAGVDQDDVCDTWLTLTPPEFQQLATNAAEAFARMNEAADASDKARAVHQFEHARVLVEAAVSGADPMFEHRVGTLMAKGLVRTEAEPRAAATLARQRIEQARRGVIGHQLTPDDLLVEGEVLDSPRRYESAPWGYEDHRGAYWLTEATFTAERRKKLAEKGQAMSHGGFPIENTSQLKDAIQAYGRAKNKAAAKRHIIKRAKALGATSMLPSGWLQENTDTLFEIAPPPLALVEVDSRSLPDIPNKPGKTNWVEKAGGLPKYIERVAKHLRSEKGYDTSRAIATAVNHAKKMCASGTAFGGKVKVSADARAQACAAVSEWEAKKGKAKLSEAALLQEAREEGFAYPTLEECWALHQEMELRESAHPLTISFDPSLHPRNRVGQFRDVLGAIQRASRGAEVNLPGGVSVKRRSGERLAVYQGGKRVKSGGSLDEIAKDALARAGTPGDDAPDLGWGISSSRYRVGTDKYDEKADPGSSRLGRNLDPMIAAMMGNPEYSAGAKPGTLGPQGLRPSLGGLGNTAADRAERYLTGEKSGGDKHDPGSVPAPLAALRKHVADQVAAGAPTFEEIKPSGDYKLPGGLTISGKARDALNVRAASVGPEAAVDEYIAEMDKKWGADWPTIRGHLLTMMGNKGDPGQDTKGSPVPWTDRDPLFQGFSDHHLGRLANGTGKDAKKAKAELAHREWRKSQGGGALEGPFTYRSGWKGRYDPKEGRYLGMDDIYMDRGFDPDTGGTHGDKGDPGTGLPKFGPDTHPTLRRAQDRARAEDRTLWLVPNAKGGFTTVTEAPSGPAYELSPGGRIKSHPGGDKADFGFDLRGPRLSDKEGQAVAAMQSARQNRDRARELRLAGNVEHARDYERAAKRAEQRAANLRGGDKADTGTPIGGGIPGTGSYGSPKLDSIKFGDRVTIRTPQGQERSGKATLKGPHGWVLNMGGRHGTPGIATEGNIVKVGSKRLQEATFQELAAVIAKDAPEPYRSSRALRRLAETDSTVVSRCRLEVAEFLIESAGWTSVEGQVLRGELRRRLETVTTKEDAERRLVEAREARKVGRLDPNALARTQARVKLQETLVAALSL